MLRQYAISSVMDRCNYWTCVLLINLLLPGIFGLGCTDGDGRWGMLSAIVLFWLIGLLIARYFAFLSTVLIRGGCLVAISQLLVGVHLLLGSIAVDVGEQFASQHHPKQMSILDTFLSGFVATSFMGAVLVLASVFGGIAVIGAIHLFLITRHQMEKVVDDRK